MGVVGSLGAEGSVGAEGSLGAEGSVGTEGSLGAEGSVGTEGSPGAEGSDGSLDADGSLLSGIADALLPGWLGFAFCKLTARVYRYFSRPLSSGLSLDSQTTKGFSGLLPSSFPSDTTM